MRFSGVDLNEKWRVRVRYEQLVLQHRRGQKTNKSTGWRIRGYFKEREALLRTIRELCGPVHEDAISELKFLPDYYEHNDNFKRNVRTNDNVAFMPNPDYQPFFILRHTTFCQRISTHSCKGKKACCNRLAA